MTEWGVLAQREKTRKGIGCLGPYIPKYPLWPARAELTTNYTSSMEGGLSVDCRLPITNNQESGDLLVDCR